MNDEIIECPCYHVCRALGLETKRWCRLAYMLSGDMGDPERLRPALDKVREWVEELRGERSRFDPARTDQS